MSRPLSSVVNLNLSLNNSINPLHLTLNSFCFCKKDVDCMWKNTIFDTSFISNWRLRYHKDPYGFMYTYETIWLRGQHTIWTWWGAKTYVWTSSCDNNLNFSNIENCKSKQTFKHLIYLCTLARKCNVLSIYSQKHKVKAFNLNSFIFVRVTSLT